MRKIFCDGCNEELTEDPPHGFLHLPGTIFFTGRFFDGNEVEWCKECALLARGAVRYQHEK